MIPRTLEGSATLPGGESLRLMRRGDDFSIMIDRDELMNSRMSGSEEALATITVDRLSGVARPRLLIGGLGMGFTLRAALAALGPEARVELVELVPEVVDWARGPMAALHGASLDDARVDLRVGDVWETIRGVEARYDAILHDVDNGPDALTLAANDRLYGVAGLAAARRALKRGGVLAIWSAGPDAKFERRLKGASLAVETVVVRARSNGAGPRHVIWFGRKG